MEEHHDRRRLPRARRLRPRDLLDRRPPLGRLKQAPDPDPPETLPGLRGGFFAVRPLEKAAAAGKPRLLLLCARADSHAGDADVFQFLSGPGRDGGADGPHALGDQGGAFPPRGALQARLRHGLPGLHGLPQAALLSAHPLGDHGFRRRDPRA
nr:hypothetical protein SHINE37_44473 [Rhizobiaceae bacterium]